MRWVVIILGAVIGLVVLMTLVGLTRPKGHVARTRAQYRATPEQLCATLTDFVRAACANELGLGNPDVNQPNPMTRTVISSADRVMERRHSALLTRRMAEMSVPAWLMPMKNTKLMM